jgi:hypothetical protein
VNLLPYDGITEYHRKVFDQDASESFFRKLGEDVAWANDEVVMSGREMAAPWTPELQTIRKRIEEISESSFSSSLLNFHHDGSERMD